MRVLCLSGILTFLWSSAVQALINPNFTPVDLVKQSSLILEVQFGSAKDGQATAAVKRVLKGKSDPKTIALTLSTSLFPDHVRTVERLVASPEGSAGVFFVGAFAEGGTGAEPAAETQRAYLNIAGAWVSFSKGKGGDWEMTQIAADMNTTWNGGADMLLRATEYILADPDADMPVKEGVRWSHFKQFAKLDGLVHAAVPVDLTGDGKLSLYIACEGGDRLFTYDAKTQDLADITASVKLTAKSKVAAWGDFKAGGKMDLLSWDGEGLVIHTQGADGTFQAGEKHLKGALINGCLSLTCIDSGKAGHPAVVIGTKASPLLWRPDEPNHTQPIGGAFMGGDLGAPGLCLVADFDGDALPDILQLFEKGSLIYKGKAPGQFEDARRCGVRLGPGTASAFLGDYDADGLLDIFTVSSDSRTCLWNNRGKFVFADTMSMTGELSYKGDSGAIGGMTGDFNNDGRQDVLFYYAATSPHLYFNRGFRTFGLANGMDLSANNILPQAEDGAQAGCLADFTGDGTQGMVLVLKNGEAWSFYVEAEGTARCMRATLSSKGSYVGPLNVTGWHGKRCLGTWSVLAGTAEGFFGQEAAGPVLLKWQFPGGKPQQKEHIVENAPVRTILVP
jgi:hypothetical protein